MKLSLNRSEIEYGRNLLTSAIKSYDRNKLDIFYIWLNNNVIVDHKLVRDSFDKLFINKCGDRMLRLYDAMMKDYNPGKDVAKFLIKKIYYLFMFFIIMCGTLGGTVYLFRLLFW